MKILVVDDHAYNRDLLNFILEDEGHECVEAHDGRHACELFEQHEDLDIILMDVNMPVMDGLQAASVIKESSSERFVPIIFVTALDDTSSLGRCLDAGGDDFVPKPVNESVLIAKINAHARTQKIYTQLQDANKSLEYHRRLMDREHSIVEHVFKRGAERVKSTCDNVKAYSSPMSMFNGDLVLQTPSPSGGVYVLMGDFTGHGLAASIGSLPVNEIFFSFAKHQASVSRMAEEINRRLVDLLPVGMFFCATIVHMNPAGSEISIWAGGMNDAICGKKNGGKIKNYPGAHMPLGILSEEEFDDSATIIPLDKDERIYFYTDGVNEASNSKGDEFGITRIEEIVSLGGDNVIQRIRREVIEFQEDVGQSDDLSMFGIFAGPVIHRDKESKDVIDFAKDWNQAESFPWNLIIRLEDADLKKTSVVDQVMNFVSSIQGIEVYQDKIFTIVSELYSNALEHGVLGLDSSIKNSADGFEEYYRLREERMNELNGQYIELILLYVRGAPNRLEIVLTDSGKGFDIEKLNSDLSQDKENDSHGRGLGLLNRLCSHLEYSNNGRTARAVFEFQID